MKEKLIRFMQGRYGVDTFSKFLLIFGLAAALLSSVFAGKFLGVICYILGVLLIVYCYCRMFSKKVEKRYAENQAFLARTYRLRCFFQKQAGNLSQRKEYHIYKCPGCGQKIRIPRGKGRVEVRCPKCSTAFIKKS